MLVDQRESQRQRKNGDLPPDPYLLRIRDLIYKVAGIFQPDGRIAILEERCEERIAELGSGSLKAYYEHLTTSGDRDTELHALLNEITVGETCFFRSQPQLDALCRVALPAIARAKTQTGPREIRLWSAGCSTGEEPYTLTMVLLEEMRKTLPGWELETLATDLNQESLERAKAAVYAEPAVRNVPALFLKKYFQTRSEQFHVTDEVKSKVSLRALNLLDAAGMEEVQEADLIFCCNVLIYFDGAAKRRCLRHFSRILPPYGYLFVGPAESLFGVSEDFRLVHFAGATAYSKPSRTSGSSGLL